MPTRWRTSFHSAKTNQGRQDEGIQNKRLFVVPRAVPGLLLRCEARGLPRVQAIGSSTPSPTSIKTACNGRSAHPCCNFFFFFRGRSYIKSAQTNPRAQTYIRGRETRNLDKQPALAIPRTNPTRRDTAKKKSPLREDAAAAGQKLAELLALLLSLRGKVVGRRTWRRSGGDDWIRGLPCKWECSERPKWNYKSRRKA